MTQKNNFDYIQIWIFAICQNKRFDYNLLLAMQTTC